MRIDAIDEEERKFIITYGKKQKEEGKEVIKRNLQEAYKANFVGDLRRDNVLIACWATYFKGQKSPPTRWYRELLIQQDVRKKI
jgi:hypothetical protein